MKKILYVLFAAALFASCSPSVAKIDNSLKKYFDSAQVEGSFAFLNNQRGDISVYNMEMDTQRVSPGSIFKVAETLIGIETSRLTDTNTILKSADSTLSKVTLQNAFENNNDSFFRVLARNIGTDTMNHWLDTLHYGNMKASDINSFWENGELKISPDEQLGLVYKIYFDKLPFQKYAHEVVRELMLRDDNTLYKFSYATGKARSDNNKPLGWICGWIEENRHVYFFASVIRSKGENQDLEKTILSISKNILAAKGFFKGER